MINNHLIKQDMIKYLYTLILFIPLVLFSCDDDNNNEGTDANTTYKVRYEASCDNPNVTLRILYSTQNTDFENVANDAKEVFVKSPFSVELEMKKSEYCYISAQQHIEDNTAILEDTKFTTSVFVDDIKKTENTNKTVSVSYLVLGLE